MNAIHEVKSSILSVSTKKIRQPKGCLFSLVETESVAEGNAGIRFAQIEREGKPIPSHTHPMQESKNS